MNGGKAQHARTLESADQAARVIPWGNVPMPDMRPFERFPALSPELQDRADAEWRK